MFVGLILLIAFLGLLLIGIPVSISMGIATLVGMYVAGFKSALYVIPQQIVEGARSEVLLAIPLFIFAGNLMNRTGLTTRIFDFASALVGHIRGGLAQVNVLASMLFAGVSGAAVADCAGLGMVEIAAMVKRGYSKALAAAITVASSAVGPIIPPSIPMVIYGVLAGVSIGRLFLAGFLPGVLIGLSLMITNVILSYTNKEAFPPPEKRASLQDLIKTLRAGAIALIGPVIIVGGLVTGIATATEAGVLASWYAFIASFAYNKPKEVLKAIPQALFDTVKSTTMIMFIIGLATAMGWVIAFERIPVSLAKVMVSATHNKYILLLLINVFYLLIGTVVEGIPAMLITVPILLPIIDQFGIDRLHFGLITVYGILIGIATPPMGIGLYILRGVTNLKLEELIVAVLPYLIPLILVLILITYCPEITLFVPRLIMGGG